MLSMHCLNHEEMEKDLQKITKIEPFIYKWIQLERNKFSTRKDDWKKLRKTIEQLLLIFCMLQKKNISCLFFKTSMMYGKQA